MEREDTAGLTAEDGRSFGLTVGAAFLALGGLLWWRGHPGLYFAAFSIGGLLVLAGLLIPGRLGPVYRLWMRFAELISRVTTPLLMGIIYFLVVTPIALLIRTFGRNPIAPPSGESYWRRRDGSGETKSDMRRQF